MCGRGRGSAGFLERPVARGEIELDPEKGSVWQVCLRPTAIDFFKDAGLKLDGMPQYNVFWGFIVQVHAQCSREVVGLWGALYHTCAPS